MIKMIRLDERLIHGQVAIKWSRHLAVDRIVVCNDEAASNDIIKKTLIIAAPSTVKTAITSVESGIKLLKDDRCKSLNILVIVSNPEDLLKVSKELISDINHINIGNYGRVASKMSDKIRKTYRKNLYLYEEELNVLKDVIKLGVKTVYQTTPDESPELLMNIID